MSIEVAEIQQSDLSWFSSWRAKYQTRGSIRFRSDWSDVVKKRVGGQCFRYITHRMLLEALAGFLGVGSQSQDQWKLLEMVGTSLSVSHH
jgi:hypothetical protein